MSRYEPNKYQITLDQSRNLLNKCTSQPLISIITPVYKVDPKWLDLCIQSVVGQHYSKWELILVDDGSQQNTLTNLMDSWCCRDERIKTVVLEQNQGIAGATNTGYQEASGEFIGILDHDDELTPDALVWVVWSYNQHPQAKWFYSDEDLVTTKGEYHSPFYKPDYSPENLLSRNFMCHFRVYAKDVLMQIGGKRTGFDGAQDHDLALRYCEVIEPNQVVHIPRVLYHWRTIPTSASTSIQAKPKASLAGVQAVSEALERRGAQASVSSHPLSPTLYQIELQAKERPIAAIIISLQTSGKHLEQCLAAIDCHTHYSNCHVLVIDDLLKGLDVGGSLEKIRLKMPVEIFKADKGTPYSEKRNQAARENDADMIVFMDEDVRVTTANWLSQLIGTMQLDETIGAMGPMLLSPAGKILHAGMVMGIKGGVGIACRNLSGDLPGDNCRAHAFQEYSALTGSMMCVSRSAFESVGGLNSQGYPDAYSDVDLCLRMKPKAYRCIYNPRVKAIGSHKAAFDISRDPQTLSKLKKEHPDAFLNDPFLNPNLSLDNEWFVGYRNFPIQKQIPEMYAN